MDIVKGTVEPSAMVPVVALRVERAGIPNNLIAAVSDVLGKRYDRTRLVALFSEHGAPAEGERIIHPGRSRSETPDAQRVVVLISVYLIGHSIVCAEVRSPPCVGSLQRQRPWALIGHVPRPSAYRLSRESDLSSLPRGQRQIGRLRLCVLASRR